MINADRGSTSPKSLDTKGIKQYLDEVEEYKIDKELPADQQTVTKPKCNETYRNADIFTLFDDVFFGKCYLTEEKFFTSYAMDIEHFIPQNEQPDLKYEWSNLFPASHDANMMKPRKTPSGGYMNPCNPSDDVENDLRYFFDHEDDTAHFEAIDSTNLRAVNTAKLLQKLHNGDSPETQRKTAELRNAIHKRYVKILELIDDWRSSRDEGNPQATFETERKLKAHLSRKAAFTMLMRSSKAVKRLPPNFFD